MSLENFRQLTINQYEELMNTVFKLKNKSVAEFKKYNNLTKHQINWFNMLIFVKDTHKPLTNVLNLIKVLDLKNMDDLKNMGFRFINPNELLKLRREQRENYHKRLKEKGFKKYTVTLRITDYEYICEKYESLDIFIKKALEKEKLIRF